MTHLDRQTNDMSIVWKALIIVCFVMLSMLTWAAKPIANTVEQIKKKQKAIAMLKVCKRINDMEEIYGTVMKNNFISGCLWETNNILKTLRPKKSEEIDKMFQDQSSLEFDFLRDSCANGANAYMAEGKIKEVIISDIYHDKLKCTDWDSYGKELGITREDLNEE